MGPRDVVTVVRLNGDRGVTSSDPRVIRGAIDRFGTVGTGFTSARVQKEHALNTIRDLAEQMAESPHPRKVLVCIGAASLFSPVWRDLEPAPEYGGAWFDAIRDTARRNVSVYVIEPLGGAQIATGMGAPAASVGGPASPEGVPERGRLLAFTDGARSFAAETGGEAFLRSNDFDRAVRGIWHESASYYLLGYVPATTDDRAHKIDVRVKRPNVTVRARRAR